MKNIHYAEAALIEDLTMRFMEKDVGGGCCGRGGRVKVCCLSTSRPETPRKSDGRLSVQVRASLFVFQGVPFGDDGAKAGVSRRTDPVARLVCFLSVLFWTPGSQIDC